jgi:hypothetical protein
MIMAAVIGFPICGCGRADSGKVTAKSEESASSNRVEGLQIDWEKTPKIDYEDFVVEYVSKCTVAQSDITKKQKTTPFVKNEIPAFQIEGEFYGDLAWLERSPTSIDYGLSMTITSTGQFMHGEGTYGKVDVKSASVFNMKPLFPQKADSTLVKISGKLECLFSPGSLGSGAAFIPLMFIEGTKATLLLNKGEGITLKKAPVVAEEDAEIEFTFDARGNAKSMVTRGKVKGLR